MVDDEGFYGGFGGLEFEAELLLECREEGGWGVGREIGSVVAGPLEFEVIEAGKACLVDDGAVELMG